MTPPIGALQGRLTPAKGRGIQFFPDKEGEWEAEFYKAKEAGLAFIELLVRPKNLYSHPLMSVEGRARLRELSAQTDIVIPSVHGYTEKEDHFAQDLEAVVHASKEIGADVVLVSYFHEKKLSPVPDESWQNAHRLLRPATRAARGLGVRLGVEAELSAQTLLDFIAQAEISEAFGVYYDLGNQFALGFPVVKEIELLGSRIIGVHVKDRFPQQEGQSESKSVPLGEGASDFKAASDALRKIGYTRPLIIQGARGEDGKEVELYKTYRNYIINIWQQ